jgi:hypothetical protein
MLQSQTAEATPLLPPPTADDTLPVRERDRAVHLIFFSIGTGAEILFNSTVISVAYWRNEFGTTVIGLVRPQCMAPPWSAFVI